LSLAIAGLGGNSNLPSAEYFYQVSGAILINAVNLYPGVSLNQQLL